ncbi:unnamed protein product, partial [Prorocentrum cordatum]
GEVLEDEVLRRPSADFLQVRALEVAPALALGRGVVPAPPDHRHEAGQQRPVLRHRGPEEPRLAAVVEAVDMTISSLLGTTASTSLQMGTAKRRRSASLPHGVPPPRSKQSPSRRHHTSHRIDLPL